MPDPLTSAAATLNTGKLLVQGAKAAYDLVQGVAEAELKNALIEKLTEVQRKAYEARELILEQQEMIHVLRVELAAARKKDALVTAVEWREEAAWLKEPGQRPAGPYCPRCVEGGDLHLALAAKGGDMRQYRWECHTCKTKFGPGTPPDLSGFGRIR